MNRRVSAIAASFIDRRHEPTLMSASSVVTVKGMLAARVGTAAVDEMRQRRRTRRGLASRHVRYYGRIFSRLPLWIYTEQGGKPSRAGVVAARQRQQRRADCSYPCIRALRRSCRAPAVHSSFPPMKRTSPSSGARGSPGTSSGYARRRVLGSRIASEKRAWADQWLARSDIVRCERLGFDHQHARSRARTRKRECDAVLGRLAQRPTTEPKVRGSNPLGRVEKAVEISRLFVFSRNCWV
jgi:hypothetical protein